MNEEKNDRDWIVEAHTAEHTNENIVSELSADYLSEDFLVHGIAVRRTEMWVCLSDCLFS